MNNQIKANFTTLAQSIKKSIEKDVFYPFNFATNFSSSLEQNLGLITISKREDRTDFAHFSAGKEEVPTGRDLWILGEKDVPTFLWPLLLEKSTLKKSEVLKENFHPVFLSALLAREMAWNDAYYSLCNEEDKKDLQEYEEKDAPFLEIAMKPDNYGKVIESARIVFLQIAGRIAENLKESREDYEIEAGAIWEREVFS